MEKWQNFYLQSINGTDKTVHESTSQWGVWCKDIPFKIFDKVKAPAKRTWFDEDGDDEYIPSQGLFLEAYTMKVEFGCKKTSTITDVRTKVGEFLEYLRTSGHMKMYSTYTRIGRQNVRLESVSDNSKWKSDGKAEYLIFEVTFKVNDPVTDLQLSDDQSSIIIPET